MPAPELMRCLCSAALIVAALAQARPARGQEKKESAPAAEDAANAERTRRRLEAAPGAYARVFATVASGFGMRFNNPYRLSTQLGEEATSLSITPPYLDFSAAILLGDPNFIQHGGGLHAGTTLTGFLQPYLTPSYVLGYRAELPLLITARVGTPVLLAPDVNVGGEIAAGLSYFFNAGLGLTSEIAFDLFYGAATLEQQYSVIPILNFQLGVIVDYEFLP